MALKPASLKIIDELGGRYPVLAPVRSNVTRAVEALCGCFHADGQLLLCGNGGSAADCAHIVGELVKGFQSRRPLQVQDVERLRKTGDADTAEFAGKLQRGVRALALTGADALTSAFANDVDPVLVFAQQVYVMGRQGDVLLGISTSGNAKNVVAALKVGKAFGLKTIGLTGARPGAMDPFCDLCIKAPAEKTHEIQELHLPIYHALCAAVEVELFG
jgi:D-sedoheptulose 7-phosphate isomerase